MKIDLIVEAKVEYHLTVKAVVVSSSPNIPKIPVTHGSVNQLEYLDLGTKLKNNVRRT